jgi:hypothetical protein
MPLLKPPEPKTATRKLYVGLEEPLALTMERYAEFLGAHSLDHVVSQALQFIFKRDAQFKLWLEQNPQAAPTAIRCKPGSKKSASEGGRQ